MYSVNYMELELGIIGCAVGSSFAVLVAEQLFASGCELLLSVTSSGQITTKGDPPYFVLITRALRDEGTSYHYAPADAVVAPHPRALAAIDSVLTEAGVPHDRGLTWTTDAFFRETAGKVARRREQGCITVEMEASAMFAAAAFRGVVFGQLLYAGDDVSAEEWDHRHWEKQGTARDHLLDLALAAVLRL